MKRIVLALVILFNASAVLAGNVTLAVAANFLTTAEELVARFEAQTGHTVTIAHGSTGQLYSQIDSGAPFDIFLSADERRPELLAEKGTAREVRTYALGRLVLVSTLDVTRENAPELFVGRTAALADPTVAPYGLAATAAMERLGLDTAKFRPVLVANVGQAAVVYATGNAEFAFVSAAQLPLLGTPNVLELDGLYPAILQDAALLRRADGNDASAAFWAWLFSDESRALIAAAGYDLPE